MNNEINALFSLSGKTALVTGGARGLGEMMAKGLLQAGAKVYITSRKLADCDAKVEALSIYGDCKGIVADVATMEGIEKLIASFGEQEQSLDILVNNSGKTWGAPLLNFPEKAWDEVMAINVKSPFYIIQKLLGHLQAASSAEQPAHVINIGSIAALTKDSMSAFPYGASKAALHHLTGVLAKELSSKHINVNAIAPGSFPSKMTAGITKTDDAMQSLLDTIPMGRMGEPDDIAQLLIYLCSSRYMTGHVAVLDGGASL
ncbi:SDR family oxidoreductase [Colwellia sp. 20A7]|uniref:SDR family oxidoreductase n=1 Tax=Colwellia sp. 20A7 TaxID=2689569 RepID=UPI0013574335|nr:SDR family oxidoreductase [Colwellia sp. 20A7]